MNITGPLLPRGFPCELGCVAIAVYWPIDSAGLASPSSSRRPSPAPWLRDERAARAQRERHARLASHGAGDGFRLELG